MKQRRGHTRPPGGNAHGGHAPRGKETSGERREKASSGERSAKDSRRGESLGREPRRGERPEREGQRDFGRERPARVEAKRRARVDEGDAGRVASTARQQTEADGAHVFGVQPVLETLRAGLRPVERVTVAEGAHEARLHEIIELARGAGVPVRRVPRAELQRVAAGANHQGVVATVAAARYWQTEELLDSLAARVGTEDPPLALVLDGVEDPRNLGAIIRTAECAGAHGVFVPERRAAGLTETVAKAAAGALEYVPVARAANVVRLVEELKGRGVWTIGTSAEATTDYTGWDWTQPCALLLGGEGEGLRRLVREHCDVLVSIPLRGHIESLNVSVAAGIVLYEAVRQRTAAREAAYKKRGSQNDER